MAAANIAILNYLLASLAAEVCFSFPDMSSDYKVSRVALSHVNQEYMDKLLEVSKDMPRMCRKDICYATQHIDQRKGILNWPEITTSHKVELRCPFSFDVPVYTTKHCGLSSDRVAQWQMSDIDSVCPDPPMAELIHTFTEKISDAKNSTNDSSLQDVYKSFLRRVVDLFTRYRDIPVDVLDVLDLMDLYFEAFTSLISDTVTVDVTRDILSILNTLLDSDLKIYLNEFMNNMVSNNKLRSIVDILPHKIEKTSNQSLSFVFRNLAMYVMSVNHNTPDAINITELFTFNPFKDTVVYGPNISLDLSKVHQQSGQSIPLALIIIKDSTILSDEHAWYEVIYYKKTLSPIFPPIIIQESPGNDTNGTTEDRNSTKWGVTRVGEIQLHSVEKHYTYSTEFKPTASVVYLSTLSTIDNIKLRNIEIVYEMYDSCKDEPQMENCLSKRRCAKGKGDSYTLWSAEGCSVQNNSTDGYIICRCDGVQAFGVFYKENLTITTKNTSFFPAHFVPPREAVTVKQEDISAFLGYKYRQGIALLGNVLGCISLVCLLATVISYALFKRNRKGSSTTILLNLCAALTCLSILLLSIHFASSVVTVPGCTATNTLRYYLIFVTLVWNGLEAFNMYAMLALKRDINKFGMKAGFIAWGLPVLMVSICFGINRKSFDGEYVYIEEEDHCVFKCQLRSSMLHYGFLIPLAVIMIHNFIVFGIVLVTTVEKGNKIRKDQKKGNLVQLFGAVSTLLLLGIPWLFSPFGAIDARSNDDLMVMKIIFQVIFVILVNSQGLFIFIFNCARDRQVRQSWSGVIMGPPSTPGLTLQAISSKYNTDQKIIHKEEKDEVTTNGSVPKGKHEEFDNIGKT